ncbi:hypothetical protein BROUX41_002125 [Berkeleyomyces rouxiae]|uniref:uncharacterized protein n=1 Tax=Berkeleyomyces rouxiae TaxID=2035830 RepID=UPI003B7F1175
MIDEFAVYYSYHYSFPHIICLNDDLLSATNIFQDYIAQGAGSSISWSQVLRENLKPTIGVKIGRPLWRKGRGIGHCVKMSNGLPMSVEKKLDGEFCQIHVDMSRTSKCIQIFSKSGKDSTTDRQKVHSPKSSEHLMLVYYDLLYIDGQSLLEEKHSSRFKRLAQTIATCPGYGELVPSQVINFENSFATRELESLVQNVIDRDEEGLVLKPDEPFLNFDSDKLSLYTGSPIKLKPGYFGQFGEVGDFAVIGASYDAKAGRLLTTEIKALKWTHFYLACLENHSQVTAEKAKPKFRVTNVV